MAVSKAQQASVNKYISKAYDRINLTLPKGYKDQIKAKIGPESSVNGWLKELVDRALCVEEERPAQIEHIAMYVTDLERAKEFFVTYLEAQPNEGYHNQRTDFRSYFLSFGGDTRLELMHRPDMTDDEKGTARTGYIHIAFSLGSRERVNELTARLQADGYQVLSGPRTTGDGYYESCVAVIEGNQIELTV